MLTYSFEGVCKTKGELYDFLIAHDCPIFVNRDNEYLMKMVKERGGNPDIYYYGQSDNEDILIRGEVISCAPFLKFRWREQDHDANYTSEWMEVHTNLIGAYNLDNMLAAITVGYVNNIPFEQINHALNFRLMEVSPKMAILGMMGELGDVSQEEHQKIIAQLQQAGFDEVWLVGAEFQKVSSPFRTFANVDEVKEAIAQEQPQGRYILIKGSNSVKLFQLPELL